MAQVGDNSSNKVVGGPHSLKLFLGIDQGGWNARILHDQLAFENS